MRPSNKKTTIKPPPPSKSLKQTISQPEISNSNSNKPSIFSQSLLQGMSLGAGSEIGRQVVSSFFKTGNASDKLEPINNVKYPIFKTEECNEFMQKFKECILKYNQNSNEFSNIDCDKYIQKFKENC